MQNPARRPVCLIAALLFLLPSSDFAEKPIVWYKNGREKLSLEETPAEVDYQIKLKGKSAHPSVMLSVERAPAKPKTVWLPLSDGGRFDVSYLFSDGPSDYKITIFTAPENPPQNYRGVVALHVRVTGNVPDEINRQSLAPRILQFVESVKDTQVGRGECWDLAQVALDINGADWQRPFDYGTEVNPRDAQPGDIVQFRQVKLVEKVPGGGSRWEILGMPDHTAVIYEVIAPLRFRLAHQNIGNNRTVHITEVNLANKKSGKFTVRRPRPGLLWGN